MSTAGLRVVVSPLRLFVTLCLPSIPDFVSAASLWCLVCLLPTLFTGVHLEGPFINREKKGAHCEGFIRDELSQRDLEDCYGSLDNVCIVTLAPELKGGMETIEWLVKTKKIVVSLGHSMANLKKAEEAVHRGASLVTHLFNAMLPFHHRDPGLVGLLTSLKTRSLVHYGLIADNLHTHPAATRIAFKSNPRGIVLVTDSIAATGLEDGHYQFGSQDVHVKDKRATLADTNVLAGR
jgi:N-acetylglucosamine-6-phosphate deacetylase